MPTPNPTNRREYKGAAAATSLSSGMSNADTTFVLVANTNWPTGAVGNFIVTINRGFADEEKILCSGQAARTVTVATSGRGFDGTTAQLHAAGATVECTLSAFDADEWNQHTNATSGVHGVAGQVADTSSVQSFTNKTLVAPTITGSVGGAPSFTGAVLDTTTTLGGVTGAQAAADHTTVSGLTVAWTAYTPTFTNCTSPTGVFKYLLMGKTLFIRGYFTGGTATATTQVQASLPGSLVVAGSENQWLAGGNPSAGWFAVGGGTTIRTSGNVTAAASLISMAFTGVIEVA
jgi:hypothetical protein